MSALTDAIASLDVIDKLEGFVSSFLNADWDRATHEAGMTGWVTELGRTVSGSNRWCFRVPRDCQWSGAEIERFLRHYGVRLWGRGFDGPNIIFSVKERQANWAEYLMLRRGIPVAGPLFNPQNAAYGQQHAPGDQPPAWADRPRSRSFLDDLLDLF